MVRIVRADMRDERRIGGELCIVGSFDGFVPVGEHLIEFLHQVVPLRGREVVEGLVIVAIEFLIFLALEVIERALSQYQMW